MYIQDRVLDFLAEIEDASVQEMMLALDLRKKKQVRNAIDKLREKGEKITNVAHGSERFRLERRTGRCGRRICASECTALRQLKTALRLYSEGDDLYSVITLAGASEGVWGDCLQQRANKKKRANEKELADEKKAPVNAWDSLTKATIGMGKKLGQADITRKEVNERINGMRNALKHFSDLSEDDPGDPQEAAKLMLDHAIENYFHLTGNMTDAMIKFQDEILMSGSGHE